MARREAKFTRKSDVGPSTDGSGATVTARKGRKPVDPNETRDQKLARLADARVTKAIKYIGYVGNLAAYRPTKEQIDKIVTALASSCQSVQNRLEGVRKESFTFTLNQ